MNNKPIKKMTMLKLIKFLQTDNDFLNTYKIYQPKNNNAQFCQDLENFIFAYDLIVHLIDKRYLDIAWFSTDDLIFNLDTLYFDWQFYCENNIYDNLRVQPLCK